MIIAVALLLLGPDKLPEVAAKLGSAWSSLKNIQKKIESEVRQVVPDLPSTGDIARIARNPVNMLNKLAEQSRPRQQPEKSCLKFQSHSQ